MALESARNLVIYDDMAKEKRPFEPLTPGKVTMYVCGPTVYGEPHIGNLRTFNSGDLIRRWLEYRGYDVFYVMNITDIEDKTIRDSGKEGKSLKEFTEYYSQVFLDGLDLLSIKRATAYPRPTEYIPQMIEFIKGLEVRGIAYPAEDGVYFAIDKFPGYGKLSGIDLDKVETSERMTKDEYDKESVHDFALWKTATPEELERGIYYETPWGKGRPGWHIECSVMSKELLGETIDIHAGGEDLVFPHHENEIAQSESLTGKKFVRYWMHMRFLMMNGRKMSKSLGNYVSFEEVLSKRSADAFRYFYISTHYRRPLNYTESAMESAENSAARLENTLALIENAMRGEDSNLDYGEREAKLLETIKELKAQFEAEMDDDFNSPGAITALHAMSGAINEYLTHPANKGVLHKAAETYRELLGVLGLFEKRGTGADELTEGLIGAIAGVRERLREEKNYAFSDMIRDDLSSMGVILSDTPEGTGWKIERK